MSEIVGKGNIMLSYFILILMGATTAITAFFGTSIESRSRKRFYEKSFGAQLEIALPGSESVVYRLSRTSYVLGRRPRKCDIQLNHQSVSRIHALITRNDNAYFIEPAYNEDARQWGIVSLNGRQISNAPYRLLSGDQIHIGQVSITYKEETNHD